MALKAHLIGGEWVEGTEAQDDLNPSDLSDVVGVYARADRALAEQAIAAAKAAFAGWSRSTPQQRFDLLDADRRRRLSRALRRPQGLELRPARAGPLRGRVLHHGQDRLHAP